MKMAVWLGGILVAGGLLLLVGYAAYGFFSARDVPLLIKVAFPIAGLGFVVLLGVTLYQRLARRRKEKDLEGVQY